VASFERWRKRARQLKLEVYTLYLAYRDPRVPWYAKVFAACVAGYVFSPIDLIPDVIPILGYLDELVLIPLAVLAARRMIPPEVLDDCRARAETVMREGRPVNRIAAAVVVVIWIALAGMATWLIIGLVRPVE
jgi:uncharacterized membrane protein YkvA (DUF1232 family)